jgi:hypothetical protein
MALLLTPDLMILPGDARPFAQVPNQGRQGRHMHAIGADVPGFSEREGDWLDNWHRAQHDDVLLTEMQLFHG